VKLFPLWYHPTRLVDFLHVLFHVLGPVYGPVYLPKKLVKLPRP
jgi:hypothetical protein